MPKLFKAQKANANSLFSYANDKKLRIFHNKELFHDRRCEVPNTFSTRN